MMNEEDLLQFLIHNQAEMKRICLPLQIQYDTLLSDSGNKDHLDEIKEQYMTLVKQKISDEMGKMLGADAETSNLFLEKINIMEYMSL